MSLWIGRAPSLSKSWQVLVHFGGMLNLFTVNIVDITHCHVSFYKYYMNHGWTADICKIYCPSLLRGILRMPDIFHLNRWKLQRRDGASVGGKMKRKRQQEKDDGGRWTCACMFMCRYVQVRKRSEISVL